KSLAGHSLVGKSLFNGCGGKPLFDGCNEILHADRQNVDATLVPRSPVNGVRVLLDRPRLEVLALLLPPQSVQHHSEVPVSQAVTEEEKVASPELRRERDRKQARDIGPS